MGEWRRLVWETYGDLGIARSREVTTPEKVLAEMGAKTVRVCSVCLENQRGYEEVEGGCWNCDAPVVEAWLVVKGAADG